MPLIPLGELSSRSIRLLPQGLQHIVVRGHSVAIHISNNIVDATAICNVANLDKAARNKLLRRFRRNGLTTAPIKIKGRTMHTWIPVEEGKKLCQKLNLNELEMLFSKAPESRRNQEKLPKPPRSNESKTAAVHSTTDSNDRTASPLVPDERSCSQLTEWNGEYGSFLAPPDKSYSQLLEKWNMV